MDTDVSTASAKHLPLPGGASPTLEKAATRSLRMDTQRNWMKRLVATRRGDIMLHTFCGSRPLGAAFFKRPEFIAVGCEAGRA